LPSIYAVERKYAMAGEAWQACRRERDAAVQAMEVLRPVSPVPVLSGASRRTQTSEQNVMHVQM